MPNKESFRLRYTAQMLADTDEAEVMLYGEIIQDMPEYWKWSKEDKSAAEFDKAIKKLKDDGAKRLLLRINSPGGIVSEAVAMRAILVNARFESIRVRIEGTCASAATIPATIPGAHVSIHPGSEYMIHNPRTWGEGTAENFEHIAKMLHTTEDNMRAFYAKKTGKADDEIKAWMDAETWFTAEESVKNGFCDELVDEETAEMPIVACVSPHVMSVMRGLYNAIPSRITVQDEATHTISNDDQARAAGKSTENNTMSKEVTRMEPTTMTLEALQAQHPELCKQIMQAGAQQERERIQDIDDLTPTGYEEMAEEAKTNGTSAIDYHKAIVKAQKQKNKDFLAGRKRETAASANITGGEPGDNDGARILKQIEDSAKEIAAFAKGESYSANGMF